MRICFLDPVDWDYAIESVYQRPLGGTQSAMCYLAEELVKLGHEIFLINKTKYITTSLGVTCLPTSLISADLFDNLSLDVCIVLNDAGNAKILKRYLPSSTLLILWTGHNTNQPGVELLKNEAELYDYFVFLSQWQKNKFVEVFGLSESKLKVFAHCVSPTFLKIFSPDESIISTKLSPITLAYTSTPFRGLDILLEIFPEVYAKFPNCQLKVFSDLKVYQVDDSQDQAQYGSLYSRCCEIPGIEYIGSLPQPELAKHLKSVTALTYPNTFEETGCIAVMEAMASGCQVITTDMGALPETTANFAELIPVTEEWEVYKIQFAEAVINALRKTLDSELQENLNQKLSQQVQYIQKHHNWQIRAKEWETWLTSIIQQNQLKSWPPEAKLYYQRKQYDKALQIYENAIEEDPDNLENYWQAGILLVLLNREEEAQLIWSIALAKLSQEEVHTHISYLTSQLLIEAEHQYEDGNVDLAFAIRGYIKEFAPEQIANLIWIINVALENNFEIEYIKENLLVLQAQLNSNLNIEEFTQYSNRLENLLKLLTDKLFADEATICFLKSLVLFKDYLPDFSNILDNITRRLMYKDYLPHLAVDYGEIYLDTANRNYESLLLMSDIYRFSIKLEQAEECINEALSKCDTLSSRVLTLAKLRYIILCFGSRWEDVYRIDNEHLALLSELIKNNPQNIPQHEAFRLLVGSLVSWYLYDEPSAYLPLLSELANLCCSNIQNNAITRGFKLPAYNSNLNWRDTHSKKLKIGYVSSCFRTHSVGWLARWLISSHNHSEFEIFLYFVGANTHGNDPLQEWYKSLNVNIYTEGSWYYEIAEKIIQDEINILIDLDSGTFDGTCGVMALKPAPIQATWLGFDTFGLPTIDYFIADPYVLPNIAQEYYPNSIWRLPQTYLGIGGFEVNEVSLKRQVLGIESDAIIYMSAQTGLKRHPSTVRLQMEIIKKVPNSYFLIKGLSDEKTVKQLFESIATEIGISLEQLRFISGDPTSMVHRANLGIADVILDTFPYNGATTTLEALWMGIPLVTRVGQQFAARNSYTFLKNAGVEEGIAWSAEEYVEWGVRFGTDHELRRKVAEKLRRARYSAPLWDAKGFTKEVEAAYQAMWHHYVTGEMILPPGHRIG
ncbi:glycosyltransferase [Thermosynechococcaceae cyanobacterium BACA0444]|uniref:protein O-GlcNAc transferase n=1 Tax=Pseudocalidococcus azoricus BACA0444 TaxID=2918990 RepID=A0AAE4FU10_9CYAN|nr:glycosyltransferase [Pseudocalidococcus azoricus]MDS3860845.1 glycosyltransferase [Pseudocalidococcus azoricus BACA0444]